MKISGLSPCTCALLVACGAEIADPPDPALRHGDGLVLTSTYETGSLALFDPGSLAGMSTDLLVTGGDVALRVAGERVVILDRGASNVLLLDRDLKVEQLGLPGCNPHDAVALGPDVLLVTCYGQTSMRRVDLATRQVSQVADLSGFADADGLPEMDQLGEAGGVIYASLQRLDAVTYAPTGNGLLVEIDPDSLAVIDVDPVEPGVQGYELPAENPYTPLATLPDGSLVVGCAGDMLVHAGMGLTRLDPSTGAAELLVPGADLGGPPTDLVACGETLYALVVVPDGWTAEEMRLLKIEAGGSEVLLSSPGFALAGLACDGEGRVYVGNRGVGADAGLWVIDPVTGAMEGPYPTGLPPLEIQFF